MMLANLGCFGVADKFAERSGILDTSVNDCSVNTTEQFHRVIFQVVVNGGTAFIWFVTISAVHPGAGFQRPRLLSVISVSP